MMHARTEKQKTIIWLSVSQPRVILSSIFIKKSYKKLSQKNKNFDNNFT